MQTIEEQIATLTTRCNNYSLQLTNCELRILALERYAEHTAAQLLGSKGGKAKSEAKTKAVRANAKLPRKRKATE